MVRLDSAQVQAYLKSLPSYSGCKGSVVRLRVTDFMTYHSAELRSGAHVNLIMGPNGTGKSTIVCAICLGLAGKPKILGRAVALKEYIRHGAKSATIEIELYNPDGANYIIMRHIKETSSGGTATKWFLQGKRVPPNQIEDLTSSLNIQLDNLCQFLPQDRVQDFVVMDSVSLLQNTQKALGNDTLSQRHEKLIKLTGALQDIEKNLKTNNTSLRSVQQFTKRLEKDVENYRERDLLLANIHTLNSKRSWLTYLKARNVFVSLKNQLENATKLKRNEEAKLAPLKKEMENLETRLAKYRVELNRIKSANATLVNALKRKCEEEFDRVEAKVGEEQAKLSEQERFEQDREKRIDNCNIKINALAKQLEELREKGDMDDVGLNAQLVDLEAKIRRLDDKILEINGQDEGDECKRRYLQTSIRRAELDLSNMDDLRVSRLKFLERQQRDVYEAVMYYSRPENRSRFNGQIHEPMILHVSVNDLKYGRVAERQIGFADLNGFFCEDENDVEVMLEINQQRKWRVSVTHYKGPESRPYRKPACSYPAEFMNKWGFVKVLLDLIEGPDYYIAYLSYRHHLDRILIGSEQVEKLFQEIGDQTNLTLFYTENSCFHIKQSYYSKSKVMTYNSLQPAKIMTTEINASEKQRLFDNVAEWKAEEAVLNEAISRRSQTKGRFEEEKQGNEDIIRDINARLVFRRNIQQRLDGARKQFQALGREGKDMVAIRRATEIAIMGHRSKLSQLLEFLPRETLKIQANGTKPMVLRLQIDVVQNRIISRQNEFQQMQGEVRECDLKIRGLTPQVEQAAKEAEAHKKEAIANSNNVTEPPIDVLNGDTNEKDVIKQLNQANVQLGFLMPTDPSIVRDYEEKLRQISELEKEKGSGERKMIEIQESIEKEKAEWLNPLKELIGTVNKNFGRYFSSMGCAGEVQLHYGADEKDFSKYGIRILVKFRESEPLSELCGRKGGTLQSGGERVISTALYILALQELTTVPFRVIDEINQGMDATNESRFFNLLCSLAKGKNTPQYFLLTPKMLPPVNYPDNVEFHFIMSGPHVNVPLAVHSNAGSIDEDDGDED